MAETKAKALYAVFSTGGKQYRVKVGDKAKIEKLVGTHKEGDSLVFDKVLLTDDGAGVANIGMPFIKDGEVKATLNKIGRPSLARDMAEYLERNKLISMKKEEILIRLYTGATQLNKSKVVSRMPYDGRMYMYAIIKQQQFVNLTAQNKFKMVA